MQSEPIRWKNRDALSLNNGRLQVTLLAGGGHLAELRLQTAGTSSPNLLWESPWQTADPGSNEFQQLGELYGGTPAGPFLAGYTGHALCLDTFGPPSEEQVDRGVPLHGEASARIWKVTPTADGCAMHVRLPVAQLEFSRVIRLGKNQSVLFIEECLENNGAAASEAHWVQHVSLGAPLLEAGNSFVAASIDRCRTWPDGYEGKHILPSNVDFAWPYAPTISGEATDLRLPFQHEGKGLIAAGHVAPTAEVAWVAALNPTAGLALVYCFRRRDFPWIAIWQENCARSYLPWNRNTRVRGMEFGTTPMPLGREVIRKMGTLFDTPVSCLLSAGEKRHVRYAICAAPIPGWLQAVDAVVVAEREITLRTNTATSSFVILAEGISQFLHRGI